MSLIRGGRSTEQYPETSFSNRNEKWNSAVNCLCQIICWILKIIYVTILSHFLLHCTFPLHSLLLHFSLWSLLKNHLFHYYGALRGFVGKVFCYTKKFGCSLPNSSFIFKMLLVTQHSIIIYATLQNPNSLHVDWHRFTGM